MKYAELQLTTNFTFLEGASHPEELVEQAFAYGYACIAITDRNSVAGIVEHMLPPGTNPVSGSYRPAV